MRIHKALIIAGLAASTALISVQASAATYLFQLSGSRDATFSIDTSVTPDFQSSSVFGDQISYDGIPGTYAGTAGSASIGFGTGLFATLNILGTPQGFTQFAGPSLFSLMGSTPVFNTGTFALTSIVSGASTLRISSGAVPEPATWGMMLLGFGTMGVAMRRRQKATVSFS